MATNQHKEAVMVQHYVFTKDKTHNIQLLPAAYGETRLLPDCCCATRLLCTALPGIEHVPMYQVDTSLNPALGIPHAWYVQVIDWFPNCHILPDASSKAWS
jgi:hypothetical protein